MTGAPTQASTASARGELITRALAKPGRPVSVQSLQAASGGNSRETWIASVLIDGATRRLVLRCDPDHWIRPFEMSREIAGLTLAAGAGVPAPRLLAASEGDSRDRPYIITEFLDGTAIPRRVQRDEELSAARHGFASDCGRILGRLHSAHELAADWPCPDPLDELRRYASSAAAPSPVLVGALAWLEAHRPPASRPQVPAHRDFRLGNLMIGRDGIAGVLDWETCHLSDPEEDLAWVCSPAWRYGGTQPVAGIGSREDLFAAYRKHSNLVIDPARLHWWSVYAETRWGLASMVPPTGGSAGDRMERAAIMRRACLQEHHVLQVLAEDVRR